MPHIHHCFIILLYALVTVIPVGCTPSEPSSEAVKPQATVEEPPFELEEGFRLIGLDDLEIFHGKPPSDTPTWTAEGNVLKCTGNPRGYAYSKQSFRDFTLRLDYRFVPEESFDEKKRNNSNTGFMIHINGENKLWPVSLEVQGKHIQMASIKSNGGAADLEIDDNEESRQSARKPVGEWNSVEIVSKEGALTSILNGTKICVSKPGELTEGVIGFQSEDFEVHFRNVRIREE